VTGSGALKDRNYFPDMKSILSKYSGAKADLYVQHGNTISFGNGLLLEVRETPGHTDGTLVISFHGEFKIPLFFIRLFDIRFP
jgi:glyoxylase-like metal-dependent hydrolase (beta-lactamase superfamily II)